MIKFRTLKEHESFAKMTEKQKKLLKTYEQAREFFYESKDGRWKQKLIPKYGKIGTERKSGQPKSYYQMGSYLNKIEQSAAFPMTCHRVIKKLGKKSTRVAKKQKQALVIQVNPEIKTTCYNQIVSQYTFKVYSYKDTCRILIKNENLNYTKSIKLPIVKKK
jgi:alkylated DNA nucleotide flippase Atl1